MPFTEFTDGEAVNEFKMYTRFFKPVSDRVTALSADTGWISLGTLTNSWVYFGAGFPTCRYRQIGRKVLLQGLIKSGTVNTNLFTTPLPAAYAPTGQQIFDVAANGTNGRARVDVLTNGHLQVVGYAASGTNGYVSLNGIQWTV